MPYLDVLKLLLLGFKQDSATKVEKAAKMLGKMADDVCITSVEQGIAKALLLVLEAKSGDWCEFDMPDGGTVYLEWEIYDD